MVSAFYLNELMAGTNKTGFDKNAMWLYNLPTTGYYAECNSAEKLVYDTVLINLMLGHYNINFYSEITPEEMPDLLSYIIKDRRLTANLSIKRINMETIEIPGVGYYYKLKVDDGLLEDIDLNNYLCRLEIENVMSKVKPEWSAMEELKYFHDYVCSRTTYIKDTENCYSITGVFVDGVATCQGYSKSFDLLCEYAGYTAVEISGYSKNQAHMWSSVCVDNEWYTFDLTWDDTVLKNTSVAEEACSYIYFGLPEAVMNRTHRPRKVYKTWLPEGTQEKDMWVGYMENRILDANLVSDSDLVGWIASRLATEYKKGNYHIEIMDIGDNNLPKRVKKLMPWICKTLNYSGYNVSNNYEVTTFTEVTVIEVEGI